MLAELHGMAQSHPTVARAATWQYIKELGDRGDLPALSILFGEGTAPDGPDGKLEGLIVGKLFGIPEAHLANPLMRINPTWQGKTFDRGLKHRFQPSRPDRSAGDADCRCRISGIAAGRRRGGRLRLQPFNREGPHRAPGDGPRARLRVPEYKNPSVRTFPIKRTRDEIVELVPGVYLGRALLTMRSGEVRLIAHFALREPIGCRL